MSHLLTGAPCVSQVEFIKNEDYKYVRLLGAFYLRLVGKPQEVYQYLEVRCSCVACRVGGGLPLLVHVSHSTHSPHAHAHAQPLYNDYRRVRSRMLDGHLALTHVDEFVDDLLTKDLVCDVTLPRIPLRWTLEATGALQPRRSVLEDGMDDALAAAEAAAGHEVGGALPPPPLTGGAADRDRDGRARRSRSRSRDGRGPRARSGSPQERQDRPGRDAFAEDGADLNDVDQVNALRAKLGMKPLR